MKKTRFKQLTHPPSQPSESQGGAFTIVHDVMESMIPGICAHFPNLIGLVAYYVLAGPELIDPEVLRSVFEQQFYRIREDDSLISVEDCMITLEGMRSVMEDYQFEDLSQLAQYADASREELLHLLSNQPCHEQHDGAQMPNEALSHYNKNIGGKG